MRYLSFSPQSLLRAWNRVPRNGPTHHRWVLLTLLLFCHPTGVSAAGESPPLPRPAQAANQAGGRTGLTVNPQNREESLRFFETYYVTTDPAHNWNGNQATCDAGTTSAEFQAAVALRINYFRAMAGVPADITLREEYNQQAQQAALMVSVNRRSSHTPTPDWRCYTVNGAGAAGNSNLYLGVFGPPAIDGYIRDPGDGNYFVGHRRWILFPQTQAMGSGDLPPTAEYSAANALWVFDDHGADPRPATREEFVAWPPPGFVPYQVIFPRWSFAYPNADFRNTTVTMTQNSTPITTTQATIEVGSGDNTLVWETAVAPVGTHWPKPTADTTYDISIDNVVIDQVARNFTYTVTVFDPIPSPTGIHRLYLPTVLR